MLHLSGVPQLDLIVQADYTLVEGVYFSNQNRNKHQSQYHICRVNYRHQQLFGLMLFEQVSIQIEIFKRHVLRDGREKLFSVLLNKYVLLDHLVDSISCDIRQRIWSVVFRWRDVLEKCVNEGLLSIFGISRLLVNDDVVVPELVEF